MNAPEKDAGALDEASIQWCLDNLWEITATYEPCHVRQGHQTVLAIAVRFPENLISDMRWCAYAEGELLPDRGRSWRCIISQSHRERNVIHLTPKDELAAYAMKLWAGKSPQDLLANLHIHFVDFDLSCEAQLRQSGQAQAMEECPALPKVLLH